MDAARNRLIFWAVLIAVLLIALAFAFWPRPVPADITQAERGPMLVTVSEEGETRVRDVYAVFAPVSGSLRRVEVEPGDQVVAGETLLAAIQPSVSPVLDPRTETQLQAQVDAARAGVAAAESEVAGATAALTLAEAELARATPLTETGAMPQRMFDKALSDAESARASRSASISALRARRFDLAAAEAALTPSTTLGEDAPCFDLFADVSGVVLQVTRESQGPVSMGEALLDIGDTRDLELVVDLLSEDAVSVSPGDDVIISGWGGEPLAGRVRVVEPFAFTKVSALGIEEQRVNVIVDFIDPQAAAGRLGHGYRADVDVVVWRTDETLKAPMTALFRDGADWAAYVVRNGRARLQHLEVGRLNGREAEVLTGLEPGDRIVEFPSDRIADGVRVAQRERA